MHRGVGISKGRRFLGRPSLCLAVCLLGAGVNTSFVLADTVDNMVIEKKC